VLAIFIIRAEQVGDMYHVLMAIDGDEERLAKQVDAVRDLPGRDEVSVTVMYVHEKVDVPPDEAGSRVIESINEDIDSLQGVPDTLEQARAELAELGIEVEVSTGKGDPAAVILDTAADIDANAICVAGRRPSPVGKAMFGSVTQSIILESERPVIVAR